ncbi:MAG: DUF4147 domain-containing protein [Halolamina sp.]
MIENGETLTDHGNRHVRSDLLDIATQAIAQVQPHTTVPEVVSVDGSTLRLDSRTVDLEDVNDVYLVGAGKGSVDVADALLELLGEHIVDGIVAEKNGQERQLEGVEVLGTGHPLPDEASLEAGTRILELAKDAGPADLVLVCITGGASAQSVVPAEGVSMADLRTTTDVLLRSGLPIEEINAVRKHLSEIKGGQLAQHIAPATAVTFVVIDEVAGEPWGPTVGDETTFDDALTVLSRHGIEQRVPASVRDHLVSGRESDVPETPGRAALDDIDTFEVILAEPVDACEAAARHAEPLGYEPMILSTSIEGESSEVATVLAGITDEIRTHGRPIEPPCVVVSGGETIVTVRGDAGDGGPNQEFALAYALESSDWADVTLLALGTDGTDGPTEFAGGLVDATTIPRIIEEGEDPWMHLRRHNSSEALDLAGDAVRTGPTGTNVMDLRLLVVEEAERR